MNRKAGKPDQARQRSDNDPDETGEIETTIREVKGKLPSGVAAGFWEGKTPCWEMCHCPDKIRSECPAPKHQEMPCWAMEGTYCKLGRHGASGMDFSICQVCRVYKKWGKGCQIELKLLGQGMDAGDVKGIGGIER